MSKIHFLLAVLLLLAVGGVTVHQLVQANASAHQLLAAELVARMEVNIRKAHKRLKRYPDSGREFKTLVLAPLNLNQYNHTITITHFKNGSPQRPATFFLNVGNRENMVRVKLEYFGREYDGRLLAKGKLVRK